MDRIMNRQKTEEIKLNTRVNADLEEVDMLDYWLIEKNISKSKCK